jgi:hypothetical protein
MAVEREGRVCLHDVTLLTECARLSSAALPVAASPAVVWTEKILEGVVSRGPTTLHRGWSPKNEEDSSRIVPCCDDLYLGGHPVVVWSNASLGSP